MLAFLGITNQSSPRKRKYQCWHDRKTNRPSWLRKRPWKLPLRALPRKVARHPGHKRLGWFEVARVDAQGTSCLPVCLNPFSVALPLALLLLSFQKYHSACTRCVTHLILVSCKVVMFSIDSSSFDTCQGSQAMEGMQLKSREMTRSPATHIVEPGPQMAHKQVETMSELPEKSSFPAYFAMLLILVLVMPVWIAEPPAHFAHCNQKQEVRQYLENSSMVTGWLGDIGSNANASGTPCSSQGRPDPQFARVCLLIRAVLLMPRWVFQIKSTETYCSNKCQGQQREAARRPLARWVARAPG